MVRYFVGMLFGGIGLAAAIAAMIAAIRGVLSTRWPRAEAEITEAAVVRLTGVEGGAFYRQKLEYRFRVGGRWIVGSRVHFGGDVQLPIAAFARRTVGRFPRGSRVSVSYNPSRLEDSVLCPGLHVGLLADLAFAIVFGLLGTLTMMSS